MKSSFPRFVPLLLLLIGIASSIAAKPAPADESADTLTLDMRDGTKLEGRLRNKLFPIQLPHGLLQVDAGQIRTIDFRLHTEELGKDRIQLQDKTFLRGLLQLDMIEIESDDGIRRLPPATIREMRVKHRSANAGLGSILLGLVTLAAMEIVLGIDNIIFLAIVAGKLPVERQPRARRLGLIAALGTRVLLLCSLSFLLGLTKPLFTLPDLPFLHDMEAREISWRDLILIAGGLFLIGKSVIEIHDKVGGQSENPEAAIAAAKKVSFGRVLIEIAVLDIVFSLDSVITAVGMVEELWVMIAAMVIAMFVMMAFAGTIADFVARNPTLKILALSFLILIGVLLIAESLGQHLDKGYIYFAMAFAVGVEVVNLKVGRSVAVKPQSP